QANQMKLNRIITLCAMAAALALSGNALAQDNGNGGPGNDNGGGQQRGMRQGGRPDMQQMIQHRLDETRTTLGFTNDTEWNAVEPLVQKVLDAQREVMMSRMGGMMGRNRGGDRGPGGFGGFGQQSSPEQTALQKAVDDNAPSAQIKDLMAKYSAVQKAKQAKLEAAQDDLRKVLNTKQEAQATLMRLLD
ncbi:MAG: hypothetical protein P4M10_04015, partial [Verrucomicrobiae bacterium]|nr:hypothetical protein [Verrucomicrobiae bacterium]